MLRAALLFLALIATAGFAQSNAEIMRRLGGAFVLEHHRMGAAFVAPTTRYDHGILGDRIEYGALIAELEQKQVRIDLPPTRVFEDIAPRVADIDGRGGPEVIVVETDLEHGAQLAVYQVDFDSLIWEPKLHKLAATDFIGQSHRWLAPAGIADFDGDGQNDIAYVETPHLGKTLRIVTLRGGELVEIASARGYTNHQIGDDFISGGVRDCGQGPELLLANADWTQIVGVQLVDGQLQSRPLAPYLGPDSFNKVWDCQK